MAQLIESPRSYDETSQVPPEVAEYRRLSSEERALRITNPRLLSVMTLRCTGCKKVIKQLAIEEALKSGKSLKQVLDEQDYVRICCRKQIASEPVVVNILKETSEQQSTIDKMRNLTLLTTAATTIGRSGTIQPTESTIRILEEMPPGLIQEGLGLRDQGDICFIPLSEVRAGYNEERETSEEREGPEEFIYQEYRDVIQEQEEDEE